MSLQKIELRRTRRVISGSPGKLVAYQKESIDAAGHGSEWNIFECKFTEVGWEDEQELSNTEVAKQM
ncbi:trichohyalin-like [Pyrus ussuriensis x Pyrus communis]|uniref:Trichohyalin-like n=1 Tax=Pyrus ussuriensis x Pyrus communis TaxID=2448454 RepID=A0A5N5HWD7_9ROSA|nr:trichohyalin-like [Pyrus ussuriensis x Pyrus communis]